ncbi:MAG: FtsX-like permease family protein, partial [Clostridia bacterium]|nr:FtsX-like permease family protein [Clostridia bacterium]
LDTVTSVQIMDLIKEISAERLVIMVTHNPELAERYSSRIVRLRDGLVIEDTNPMTSGEVMREARRERRKSIFRRRRREKAKMSLLTAFKLSARNLISKKGRTTMVGIAGSIGIVGIALVLAFSSGIKGYVASMQDDMLSGNPITVTETTYDLEALTGMMSMSEKGEIIKEAGKVYVNSLIEYLATMNSNMNSMMIKNDITRDYIDFVKAMPEEYYAAMLFGYGLDLSNNIYTDFSKTSDSDPENLSITALTSIYTSILGKTEFAQFANYATSIVPSFEQAISNTDYIASQYDVSGEIADEYDEIMLVLDSNSRLSDILLARLGYYTQQEFLNIIYEVDESELYDESAYREYFTYEELLGKSFTWYSNDTVFTKTMNPFGAFKYNHNADGFEDDNAVELKVVGILTPKEDTNYGSLSSGIYYTEALTDYILEKNADSEIVNYLKDKGEESFTSMNMNGMATGITFTYEFEYEGVTYTDTGFVGSPYSMSDMMDSATGAELTSNPSGTGGAGAGGSGMGGAGGGLGMSALQGIRILSIRNLGGVDVANEIRIYPVDFDSKDFVTGYLEKWNGDGEVSVNGEAISADDRADITYTDALSLVISIINTLIDAISTALIAFTSVSLVVSTVMIGIITYVSVVERIKEIGVIRSLGGRKRDVSHLFNAETFIIGLLSGLIGVGATYLISAIVNVIVKNLVGISNIASLPISQAVALVVLSVILTSISGIIPASSAAKKDPVVALRTE